MFQANRWILDSGAFSSLNLYGGFPHSVEEYARQILRYRKCGHLMAAVSQDYMCEPFILKKTGLTIDEHQILTIERYLKLLTYRVGVPILPVLQGYSVEDYLRHLWMYGDLLAPKAWVGVGSICKRNSTPDQVESILTAIRKERPDLRLHGFGLKITALESRIVRRSLYSADSMAWSFSARKQGRDQNSWIEAERFRQRIEQLR